MLGPSLVESELTGRIAVLREVNEHPPELAPKLDRVVGRNLREATCKIMRHGILNQPHIAVVSQLSAIGERELWKFESSLRRDILER